MCFGLIAQWIEHPPSKRVVAGSSPAQSNPFLFPVNESREKSRLLFVCLFLLTIVTFQVAVDTFS